MKLCKYKKKKQKKIFKKKEKKKIKSGGVRLKLKGIRR